jgi:hypothetical protein
MVNLKSLPTFTYRELMGCRTRSGKQHYSHNKAIVTYRDKALNPRSPPATSSTSVNGMTSEPQNNLTTGLTISDDLKTYFPPYSTTSVLPSTTKQSRRPSPIQTNRRVLTSYSRIRCHFPHRPVTTHNLVTKTQQTCVSV